MEPRPTKYKKSTKSQGSVENSKSRQQALNTCSKKTNFSEFSRAAEENKISNISHSIYRIETSWLFREEEVFL